VASGALQGQSVAILPLARCVFTTPSTLVPFKEGPERDLVNFPRPKRAVYPAKVRLGFLPDEWFTFFYNKTGVTGPYAFGAGLLTYVLSKEIWVLEHEFWGGVSLFMMIIYGAKKFGPSIGAFLEKEQQGVLDTLNSGKVAEIEANKEGIQAEKTAQFQAEGMKMLFDVKRENVALQIEAAYRQRIMDVYSEVKKRLDYQVEKQNVERTVQQKHMVNWIIDSVKKSVAAESESENLKKCVADLKGLAPRA
jgi:F-type H+-transporting ATPase subunit b